ncbi:hypothetical protein AGLY_014566 [Aphis glycines]|uniref:Uncharacterized protein n=1 Tax=Aphis glycines TaxID=307491 RepID=A0A6G0T3R1_APHGL|nr:hypothetical protein AGLY_014566 [Aphis glycines]
MFQTYRLASTMQQCLGGIQSRLYEFQTSFIFCPMIITSRNNASISNFGGGFRWKSEYPWCIIEVKSKHFPTVFKKIEKNKKKMTEKREFLRKTSFRPNRFFYMVVIQKLITHNDNDSSSNDFKYFISHRYLKISLFLISYSYTFEIQILTKIRQNHEYLQVKSKHFPTVFKKIEKNKKKMTEKREFLRKTSFRPNRFFYMVFKFLRNLSKTRKFAMRLNFKFLRNRVTITIYSQTILNICYYSKSISSRYLKILPNLNFGVFRPLKHKPPFSPTTGNYILG